MIDLYYYTSPNARKVLMALEEVELPYAIHWVDITRGDQHTPEFHAVNPNEKIPAIVDHDGPGGQSARLFESAAILLYLAEKTGRLLPADPVDRWEAITWTVWQVANHGPMAGQAAHFGNYAESLGAKTNYARVRYESEIHRLYRVLDERLSDREFIAGNELSIADLATFPWVRVARGHSVDLADYPAVKAWTERISERPSAQIRPVDNRSESQKAFEYTEDQACNLFGHESVAAAKQEQAEEDADDLPDDQGGAGACTLEPVDQA